MSVGIQIVGNISVGGGITIGNPTILMLNLDAANYTTGPWVDTISSRSFTLNNGVTYSSNGGGSLVFDANSAQYAECSSSLPNMDTWTVEAWHYYTGINAGTDSGGLGACLVTEKYLGVSINYSLGNDEPSVGSPYDLQSGFYTDGSWKVTQFVPSGYTLSAGNWYQIVGTYDGSTIKLYVNNVLSNSTSVVGTPTSSNAGIRLMRRWDNADYWGGSLAIVKIYNGDIGQTGITNSWNNNKSRFGL